jgi:hypothetical protein
MFKSFLILFLIATVVVCVACQPPTPSLPSPVPTATPTLNSPPDSWQFECYTVSMPTPNPATNEYDPSEFIHSLLQYKPFADFYTAEIEPLGYSIRYFYNPKLCLNCAYTDLNTPHTARVELGNLSENVGLPFLIAHELAGIVIIDHKYTPLQPKLSCGELNRELSVHLSDMILTPLRDAILAHYGFDVEREFYTWWIAQLFSMPCVEQNDPLAVLIDASDYAKRVLYWQDVLGNQGIPTILDCWYQKCRPNATAKGNEILTIVQQFKYDTPQKAAALFQAIINKYGLGCIRVPPS